MLLIGDEVDVAQHNDCSEHLPDACHLLATEAESVHGAQRLSPIGGILLFRFRACR